MEGSRPPLKFTVFGTPAPAGSKRGFYNAKAGRVIITDDSARSRPWKAQISDAAAEAMNGETLLDGPLILSLGFYMPRPKGHFGKRGLRPSAPKVPTVKPDLLKLARAVEDGLTGIVYRDDSQIAREVLDKFYGEPARVEVTVYRMDEA
jgi:Holliday junction resolvase RusA-like endonuclease